MALTPSPLLGSRRGSTVFDPSNATNNGGGNRTWPWIGLTIVLAIAAALRFGNIGAIGLSYTYVTAAVK